MTLTWPNWMLETLAAFNYVVVFYFLGLNTVYLCLFGLSLGEINRFVRRTFFSDYTQLRESEMGWPVTILVAAHNEERTIVDTVRSLLMLSYREFEIIVVNDGSTDDTLQKLTAAFGLRRVDVAYRKSLESKPVQGVYGSLEQPRLIVVDKIKGGKSDALNCGINLSRYPLVCSIDADSMIEENALLRVVKPFMEYPDETIAVGGIVRIANGCRISDGRVTTIALPDRSIPIMQAVEYLRAFLMGRVGWSALQSLLIISGAFGIYKKQLIVDIGGFSTESETEDLELIVRMHRYMRRQKKKYRVTFVPDPVCWTEVPTTLRELMVQRNRWHRGLIRTLWENRGMLFNPRYGAVGMFAFPYFFIFEMLGPCVEVLGYASILISALLGVLNLDFFLLFLGVSILYGIFLSVAAVLLEELSFRRYPSWLDLTKLITFGILENFGYRQMLAVFKVKGFFDLLFRRRQWGRQTRTGFKNEPRAEMPMTKIQTAAEKPAQ